MTTMLKYEIQTYSTHAAHGSIYNINIVLRLFIYFRKSASYRRTNNVNQSFRALIHRLSTRHEYFRTVTLVYYYLFFLKT